MHTNASRLNSPELLHEIHQKFQDFILEENHPCIMANTVFSMKDYDMKIYEKLGSKSTAANLLEDLQQYVDSYNFNDNKFKSFIAVFPNADVVSEIEFENLMWRQLQFIHDKDKKDWDHRVSKNPKDDNFSFSIARRAFYIVGMHPKSSRLARQAPYATLVFNLHWQFEKLREMNAYYKVRDKIRERDAELQGSINPVLKDFGQDSEAKQYSGRNVGNAWKCPFHSK